MFILWNQKTNKFSFFFLSSILWLIQIEKYWNMICSEIKRKMGGGGSWTKITHKIFFFKSFKYFFYLIKTEERKKIKFIDFSGLYDERVCVGFFKYILFVWMCYITSKHKRADSYIVIFMKKKVVFLLIWIEYLNT